MTIAHLKGLEKFVFGPLDDNFRGHCRHPETKLLFLARQNLSTDLAYIESICLPSKSNFQDVSAIAENVFQIK